MNPSLKRSADASKAAPSEAPRTIEYFDIIDALNPRPPPPVKPRGPLGSWLGTVLNVLGPADWGLGGKVALFTLYC